MFVFFMVFPVAVNYIAVKRTEAFECVELMSCWSWRMPKRLAIPVPNTVWERAPCQIAVRETTHFMVRLNRYIRYSCARDFYSSRPLNGLDARPGMPSSSLSPDMKCALPTDQAAALGLC